MTGRGSGLGLGPRLGSLQGRLWWLLAGVGYGLGDWAMQHIAGPDSAREQRIWEGILARIDCDQEDDG